MAIFVVMGVSGCGKSTVGAALAARLGWDFAEADRFHPTANVDKMRAGIPLTDADRAPWLDAIAGWIDEARGRGRDAVVACSALKRAYRERLARGHDDVRFVFLDGDQETIAARLARRQHEYMPASLLASQIATLERPAPDEPAITVPVDGPSEAIVDRILQRLERPQASGPRSTPP